MCSMKYNFKFKLYSYLSPNEVELATSVYLNKAEKKSKIVIMNSQDILNISDSFATENRSALPNGINFEQMHFSWLINICMIQIYLSKHYSKQILKHLYQFPGHHPRFSIHDMFSIFRQTSDFICRLFYVFYHGMVIIISTYYFVHSSHETKNLDIDLTTCFGC